MRTFAFISLITLHLQAADIGSISELKGEAAVNRSGEALTAALDLGVESYDDVRTANSRVGLTFIDDSVVRLTEHSKLILDEVIFDPDPTKSRILKNTTVPEVSNAAEISNAAEMSRLYKLLFKFPTEHQKSTLKCFALMAGLNSKKQKMNKSTLILIIIWDDN